MEPFTRGNKVTRLILLILSTFIKEIGMGTNPTQRPPIHHRDQNPQLYIRKEEELLARQFEKLSKFLHQVDEFRESSSITFTTSPALLGKRRR